MAVLVTVHAAGMVSLGNQPWLLLGIVIGAGNAFIWWSTERILGPIQGDTHGGQREDLAARAAARVLGIMANGAATYGSDEAEPSGYR
jgi:hypothetical protein